MATEPLILYFGADESFHQHFKVSLKNKVGDKYKVQQIKPLSHLKTFQSQLLNLYEKQPLSLLIDFTSHFQEMIFIARTLARTHKSFPLSLVGLHDFQSPAEAIEEAYLSGCVLNYIKSDDHFDLLFGLLKLLDKAAPTEHGFAVGDVKANQHIGHLAKVGFLTQDSLHFESNLPLKEGDVIQIKSSWNHEKMIPSKKLKIKKQGENLIFYLFKSWFEAEFTWIDELIIADGTEAERVRELKDNREGKIRQAKKRYHEWIENNQDKSFRKSVRILVVDASFKIFEMQESVDNTGYSIRFQPFIPNYDKELNKTRPHLIAWQLEKPNDKAKRELNTPDMLKSLVAAIQKIPDYRPYIFAFGTESKNSQNLQEYLNYPQAMASADDFNAELLLKMSSMLQAKLKPDPVIEGYLYVRKSSSLSIAEVEEEVFIEKISECDVFFKSSKKHPSGTVVHLARPVDCYFTLVEDANSKGDMQYAVINGLTEKAKTELRRYVNSLFFKDLDQNKAQELKAFKELNEQKMQEKQKAEQQTQEKVEEEVGAQASLAPSELKKETSPED
jgi:hypothetical protein